MADPSVTAALSVVGQSPKLPLVDLSLTLAHGKHSIVTATFQQTRKSQPIAKDGTPAQAIWGRASGQSVWHGYVHHHQVVTTSAMAWPQVIYTLIGTSSTMNSERRRSWRNVSDSYVIRQVAKDHKMRSIVSVTAPVWKYIAQAESDFHLVNRLAAQDGYKVWIDGDTLTYRDPLLLMEPGLGIGIPRFTFSRLGNDSVLTFDKISGATAPIAGVQATYTTYGLNSSGQLVSSSSSPDEQTGLVKITNVRPIISYADAAQSVTASKAANAHWITARVQVLGDVRLLPGQLLYLDGTALDDESLGYWLVDSVTHSLQPQAVHTTNPSHFTSVCQLIRSTVPIINDVLTVGQATRSSSGLSLSDDGFWSAQVQEEIVYGI